MPQDAFLVCVYYYCLPEFPANCAIVKDNSLFVRDVLVSHPTNRHIKYGGQYDPHYEHSFAPQFKMCWKNTRRKIMSLVNDNTYDKIHLLFRTNKVSLSRVSTHFVMGYYDIDIDKVDIDPNYEEPVIYAKEARFVNQESAINISDFLMKSRNPRFPFSSESRNGIFRKHLNNWVRKIESSQNFLDDYISVTKNLDKIFKYYEFEEGIYPICNDCIDIGKCHLTKRIHKRGKLYHQLPEDIASRINRYYKSSVTINIR